MGSHHRIIGPRAYCPSYEDYAPIVRINGRPVCDYCLQSLAGLLPANWDAFIDEALSPEPNPSAESGSEQPTPKR
jgi:hypothetical protein